MCLINEREITKDYTRKKIAWKVFKKKGFKLSSLKWGYIFSKKKVNIDSGKGFHVFINKENAERLMIELKEHGFTDKELVLKKVKIHGITTMGFQRYFGILEYNPIPEEFEKVNSVRCKYLEIIG